MSETEMVLQEVEAEREAQERKWGQQDHPDGTGPARSVWDSLSILVSVANAHNAGLADAARHRCDYLHKVGEGTYEQILTEEVFEAYAADTPAELRAELIQVAAVAVAWVEAIDRRAAVKPPPMTRDLLEQINAANNR